MWSSWLSDSTIPALEQSIAFAQRRHTLLAGNIANLDVPDYRTRDLSVNDFQDALRSSIQSQQSDFHQSPGSAVQSPSRQTAQEKLRDVRNQILYHDGNDISLEQQVTEISKNQMMHDTAIALMRSQFQTLQAAIRESVAI
jgi:flagellar basal-body rod protein FlgB